MSFVVTGTDTGIGKTVFSAALAGALGLAYWKPVQAGTADGTDSETVRRLAGVEILPEAYVFKTPASPHWAAEVEGRVIDPGLLVPPEKPAVIEGAGGLITSWDGGSCAGGQTILAAGDARVHAQAMALLAG